LIGLNGYDPDVKLSDNGDFVVTWDSNRAVVARRFNGSNVPQNNEFQVSTGNFSSLWSPKIAMDATGDYSITWQGKADNNSYELYAQRFENRGSTSESGSFNKIITGIAKADRLRGTAKADLLLGLGGADVLIGKNGNDRLQGDTGRDQLSGGKGQDWLIGGAGRDRFVLEFRLDLDVIADFRNGQDRLMLSGTLEYRDLTIVQRDNNTLISVNQTVLAQLNGVTAAQVTTADFIIR
jgi:Ca2+-binding RTX toxin-like protein